MSTIIITADSGEPDRLFASTVRAMRRSLDATEDQLRGHPGSGASASKPSRPAAPRHAPT